MEVIFHMWVEQSEEAHSNGSARLQAVRQLGSSRRVSIKRNI